MQNKIKETLLKTFKGTEDDWNDWVWQMQHRIISADILNEIIPLTKERKEEIEKTSNKFRFAISPYYLSLIDIYNENDIIAKMSFPSFQELDNTGLLDPSNEELTSPISAVTRRYPDRIIINVTNSCGSYCRHCQRRRLIGSIDTKTSKKAINEALIYIKNHKEIRDVIITGGDALSLGDDEIEFIILFFH